MIRLNNGKLVIGKVVEASPLAVWDILTDTTRWPEWGPSVLTVDSEKRYICLGCTGRVRTIFGFWLPFTITEVIEARLWTWRIGKIEATGHHLHVLGDKQCLVSFSMAWWAFPYLPVCSIALSRIRNICLKQ